MEHDTWEFTLDHSRCFSVKSIRKSISNTLNNTTIQSTRWNKLLPSKVNMSLRVYNQRLPTRANLDKPGIDLESVLRPTCNSDIETEVHTDADSDGCRFSQMQIHTDADSNGCRFRRMQILTDAYSDGCIFRRMQIQTDADSNAEQTKPGGTKTCSRQYPMQTEQIPIINTDADADADADAYADADADADTNITRCKYRIPISISIPILILMPIETKDTLQSFLLN
ncbi:hypothetical protein Tco_1557046 [Tanacetum coccineum]